ncbi:hypothetical protein OGATHE_004175 [Ogataea polymorpha]|uniref:Uncharacterized protein n=1 Tax=Ogataea polymorpha TaxID=460523 RepID=A0A9P8T4K5_9ASCO|nr:hypothetical protein OGATHE_004175 [Ogataea polymorpha]
MLATAIMAAPPNPAVIPRAGTYLGASFARKMFVEMSPAAFASGTPTAEITTLLFSFGVLLLYHVEVSTDDADEPVVIRKHEKYATPMCACVSMQPNTTNPISVEATASTIKMDRTRSRSEAKHQKISATAPQTLGATVYRFVMTVPLPRDSMICGNQLLMELSGTPMKISSNIHAMATGCLKTLMASMSDTFSVDSEDESVRIRQMAHSRSSSRERERAQHKWDVEDGEHVVPFLALDAQIHVQLVGLCVGDIALVERIKQIHHGDEWQDPDVELPTNTTLELVV